MSTVYVLDGLRLKFDLFMCSIISMFLTSCDLHVLFTPTGMGSGVRHYVM